MFVRFFLCWLCFGMFVGLFVSLDVFGSFFVFLPRYTLK